METAISKNKSGSSVASVDASLKALHGEINIKQQEKNELNEITQNQLKNINELQKKCEESYIAINHLVQSRETAAARYDEAMKESMILQNKQFKVNELLNLSMTEFDETINLVNTAKLQLECQKNLANQRMLIYDADPKELMRLGKKTISIIEKNLHSKCSLQEEVKAFMKSIRLEELKRELESIVQKNKNLEALNAEATREIAMIERNYNETIERITSLDCSIKEKVNLLNNELDCWKLKVDEGKKSLLELKGKLENITKILELQQAEHDALKEKFDLEVESVNSIENEIVTKKKELENMKYDLESSISNSNHLKKFCHEMSKTKDLCEAANIHIKELEEKKELLADQLKLLNDELGITRENVSKTEAELEDINLNIGNLRLNLNTTKTKIADCMESFEQLKKERESTIGKLCSDIENLKTQNSNLVESIEEKKKILNERTQHLETIREEYENTRKELDERKEKIELRKTELTSILNSTKEKFNDLSEVLENKKKELAEKRSELESISQLSEKIETLKKEHRELLEKLESEKEELKISSNGKIEDTIAEMQALKAEKQKILEEAKDKASKAEFTYYKLKSQTQRLKGVLNYTRDIFMSYQCENEMLSRSLACISRTPNPSTSRVQSPPEDSEDNFSLAGDKKVPKYKADEDSNSSFDDTDEMPAPEMSTQEYLRAKTLNNSYETKKATSEQPKAKKRKVQPKDKKVFDWVESSSSQ